jgi:hypothetical protein
LVVFAVAKIRRRSASSFALIGPGYESKTASTAGSENPAGFPSLAFLDFAGFFDAPVIAVFGAFGLIIPDDQSMDLRDRKPATVRCG